MIFKITAYVKLLRKKRNVLHFLVSLKCEYIKLLIPISCEILIGCNFQLRKEESIFLMKIGLSLHFQQSPIPIILFPEHN